MGGESSELSRLFDKPGRAWSFSPQVSLPIFTGGRNKASLDASRIGKRIEIANYEKTIQTAFRDLFSAQQDLISIRSAQLQNLVMLYKALGGGCE